MQNALSSYAMGKGSQNTKNTHSAYSVVAACSGSVPSLEYVERSFIVHYGESEARLCVFRRETLTLIRGMAVPRIKVRVAAYSGSVPGLEYVEHSPIVHHGESEAAICRTSTLRIQASNPNLNSQIGIQRVDTLVGSSKGKKGKCC